MRGCSTIGVLVLLGACGSGEPAAPAPDPCPDLRARFETLRVAQPCATRDECVEAPNVPRAQPADEGVMGRPAHEHVTCSTATHRDALPAVEAAARAFEAAGCGAVIPAGATCAIPWGHGLHLECDEQHQCQAGR